MSPLPANPKTALSVRIERHQEEHVTDLVQQIRSKAVPLLQSYAFRITLFGSVARGETSADSDVDLLVALRPPDHRPPLGLKWFALEAALSDALNRPVKMVTEEALSPHLRPFLEPIPFK